MVSTPVSLIGDGGSTPSHTTPEILHFQSKKLGSIAELV